MKRVRISTTVDATRLAQARDLAKTSDARLLDAALADLIDRLQRDREIEALTRLPYEADPELRMPAPPSAVLPYEGEVPAEVRALARSRRAGR